jgi:hypothetical protein
MSTLGLEMTDHDFSYGWADIKPTQHYHNELRDRAQECWIKAQEMVSKAEDDLELGRINQDAWYEVLTEATLLQDAAIQLESLAMDAQIEFWKQQYAEEDLREREHQEQMVDERPY